MNSESSSSSSSSSSFSSYFPYFSTSPSALIELISEIYRNLSDSTLPTVNSIIKNHTQANAAIKQAEAKLIGRWNLIEISSRSSDSPLVGELKFSSIGGAAAPRGIFYFGQTKNSPTIHAISSRFETVESSRFDSGGHLFLALRTFSISQTRVIEGKLEILMHSEGEKLKGKFEILSEESVVGNNFNVDSLGFGGEDFESTDFSMEFVAEKIKEEKKFF